MLVSVVLPVLSREWLEFEGGVISGLLKQAIRRWSADGDHAMDSHSTKPAGDAVAPELFAGEEWFDPLEAGVRLRIRGFIEAMLESELDAALSRGRYERRLPSGKREQAGVGHRHGHRERSLTGTFGPVRLRVPRARLATSDGGTAEWKNATIPAYQRRTRQAEALIAGAYLAGANTRRVRRALGALFGDSVGKDTVSRAWRKAKTDWEAWNRRDLSNEPIVRLILDGTAARVRLDRKATSISLLVVLGVRADGQKILLAVKNMGGESEAAWRGCSTISCGADCGRPNSSSWTAGAASSAPSPRCGARRRCSAAPCTSTGTFSPMRLTACMRRLRPTTPT